MAKEKDTQDDPESKYERKQTHGNNGELFSPDPPKFYNENFVLSRSQEECVPYKTSMRCPIETSNQTREDRNQGYDNVNTPTNNVLSHGHTESIAPIQPLSLSLSLDYIYPYHERQDDSSSNTSDVDSVIDSYVDVAMDTYVLDLDETRHAEDEDNLQLVDETALHYINGCPVNISKDMSSTKETSNQQTISVLSSFELKMLLGQSLINNDFIDRKDVCFEDGLGQETPLLLPKRISINETDPKYVSAHEDHETPLMVELCRPNDCHKHKQCDDVYMETEVTKDQFICSNDKMSEEHVESHPSGGISIVTSLPGKIISNMRKKMSHSSKQKSSEHCYKLDSLDGLLMLACERRDLGYLSQELSNQRSRHPSPSSYVSCETCIVETVVKDEPASDAYDVNNTPEVDAKVDHNMDSNLCDETPLMTVSTIFKESEIITLNKSIEKSLAPVQMSLDEVLLVLDRDPHYLVYFMDDGKLEIHVDFNKRDYLTTIKHLYQATGWEEMDFRIKEHRPSMYTMYSLIPGTTVAKKGTVDNGHSFSVIGTFIRVVGEDEMYALSVAHVFDEGEVCYLDRNVRIGVCVEVVKCNASPISYDLAIIKLERECSDLQNTIFSSKGVPCTFRFPCNKREVVDIELWKVQRKAHGTWQYGFFRHSSYTNKDHGIYRARTVVRANEDSSFISEGDCGSLVTSLPRDGKLTVFGMLNGCVLHEADDGGEPIELFTAFPLEEALHNSQLFYNKVIIFYE